LASIREVEIRDPGTHGFHPANHGRSVLMAWIGITVARRKMDSQQGYRKNIYVNLKIGGIDDLAESHGVEINCRNRHVAEISYLVVKEYGARGTGCYVFAITNADTNIGPMQANDVVWCGDIQGKERGSVRFGVRLRKRQRKTHL
jgi:hypothetical protein